MNERTNEKSFCIFVRTSLVTSARRESTPRIETQFALVYGHSVAGQSSIGSARKSRSILGREAFLRSANGSVRVTHYACVRASARCRFHTARYGRKYPLGRRTPRFPARELIPSPSPLSLSLSLARQALYSGDVVSRGPTSNEARRRRLLTE